MKFRIPALILLPFLILSCGKNLEKVEVTDYYGYKSTFTRNKVNNAKEGKYVKYDPEGVLYEEAFYQNDTLHGERKLFFANGNVETLETYSEGNFEGPYKVFYEQGALQLEGLYQNNMASGTWKKYYESGQLMEEVLFEKNLENGPFIEYHENGKLKAKGSYLDGDNEHGELLLYDENGELKRKMDCNKGICKTTWLSEAEKAREQSENQEQ